jgi:hypothetical protein
MQPTPDVVLAAVFIPFAAAVLTLLEEPGLEASGTRPAPTDAAGSSRRCGTAPWIGDGRVRRTRRRTRPFRASPRAVTASENTVKRNPLTGVAERLH